MNMILNYYKIINRNYNFTIDADILNKFNPIFYNSNII